MYIGLHIKYPLFLSDSNETLIFLTHTEQASNIQLHENLSSGNQIVACGQTDMTNLIAAFCNVMNMAKNKHVKDHNIYLMNTKPNISSDLSYNQGILKT
jgi:hypothetical protein